MSAENTIIGYEQDSRVVQAIALALQCEYELLAVTTYDDGEKAIKKPHIPTDANRLIVYIDLQRNRAAYEDVLRILSHTSKLDVEVILFAPFLPYTRNQELADTLIRGLYASGVACVATFDMHQPVSGVASISASSYFAQNTPSLAVISPDQGGRKRAEKLAQLHYKKSYFGIKKRLKKNTQIALPAIAEKRVIVYDDIVASGGTLRSCLEQLENQGVREVFVCITHLVGKQPQYEGPLKVQWIDSPMQSPAAIAELFTAWLASFDAQRIADRQRHAAL